MTTNIDPQTDAIFRSLDDMSPSALELFAAALRLADEPLAWFAARSDAGRAIVRRAMRRRTR